MGFHGYEVTACHDFHCLILDDLKRVHVRERHDELPEISSNIIDKLDFSLNRRRGLSSLNVYSMLLMILQT